MAKQNKKTNVQTGGKKRKDRGLIVRVGPAHPRPRLRPHPRPRPRNTVVCNIL